MRRSAHSRRSAVLGDDGFRNGCQRAELIATARSLRGRSTEWGSPLVHCTGRLRPGLRLHNTFGRHMDHGAKAYAPTVDRYIFVRSSRGRVVFATSGLVYISGLVRPTVGLRRGCSVSQTVFRWVRARVVRPPSRPSGDGAHCKRRRVSPPTKAILPLELLMVVLPHQPRCIRITATCHELVCEVAPFCTCACVELRRAVGLSDTLVVVAPQRLLLQDISISHSVVP